MEFATAAATTTTAATAGEVHDIDTALRGLKVLLSMSGQIKAFNTQIKSLVNLLKENVTLSNNKKRIMYSKVELFRSYIRRSSIDDKIAQDLEKQLNAISSSLNLKYMDANVHWYDFLDEWIRLVVVWEMLVTAAVVLSVPMIIIRLVDFLFVDLGLGSPYGAVSSFFRVVICKAILYTSGVVMRVDGVENIQGDYACSLACFSHASTLDAFILGAVIPGATCSLAKRELFLIPFFSWLLFAFGAVPVDRKNRAAAVTSLNIAASSGACVTIAPEGTRSTTGQLLAFKKGPFHMWEQLRVPIVPIVIMGAYEMQPPGNNMAVPGLVHVKFLRPVEPDEVLDREAMSNLVRKRMLECLLKTPEDTCRPLSSYEVVCCRATLLVSAIVCTGILWRIYEIGVSQFASVSTKEMALWVAAVSIGGTFFSYVYCVYIQRWTFMFFEWTTRKFSAGNKISSKKDF